MCKRFSAGDPLAESLRPLAKRCTETLSIRQCPLNAGQPKRLLVEHRRHWYGPHWDHDHATANSDIQPARHTPFAWYVGYKNNFEQLTCAIPAKRFQRIPAELRRSISSQLSSLNGHRTGTRAILCRRLGTVTTPDSRTKESPEYSSALAFPASRLTESV